LDRTNLRIFTADSLKDMLWKAGYLVAGAQPPYSPPEKMAASSGGTLGKSGPPMKRCRVVVLTYSAMKTNREVLEL
jgi:hypothetical protein